MTKVFVELNIPECCEICPFYHEYETALYITCSCHHPNTLNNSLQSWFANRIIGQDKKPEWCPFNKAEIIQVIGESSQCDSRFSTTHETKCVYLENKE